MNLPSLHRLVRFLAAYVEQAQIPVVCLVVFIVDITERGIQEKLGQRA
jgi:hypothetical protein